ncbi:protein ENHANCED DISEASE RESISTANCE 4-like [Iris pallida]|uniref:Protein ENHANCED DISEASE RESISTANCE 4-like n=1 Tax=Iris pallida TaxID=29817 RepID=A0AAX6G0D4_IRIPA|nr:protein ENHANCED DISEASE RESISTANCE 4-like [Iris pallida]KAJ6847598.1 protein ENHANCED DISEASE RESISTANCE 4-like [Iris pallida]
MEEEGAKVRVVRCPKCDKLLPELANFSVYRCGGCNATLQAKKQVPTSEASSEKSNGEVVKYLENTESSSENKGVVVSIASSEVDQKVVRVDFRKEEKRLNLNESPESDSSLMATSEYRDALKEPDSSRLDDLPMESGTESRISKYRRSSNAPLNVPATDVDNSVDSKVEDQEAKMPFDRTTEYPKFQLRQARREEDRERTSAFHLPVPYPDEGPSNYHPNTSKKRNLDNANSAEFPDHDRAELLRKLDELRDQLRRSCEVAEKPKERASVNRTTFTSNPHGRTGRGNWFPEGSSSMNRMSSRHSPYMNGHNMDIPNLYPAVHPPNGIPAYSEVFAPHSLGRAPFHPPGQYPQRPMNNNYLYGQFDPDPLVSYHHDGFYHQPACSCLHCYNSHWPTIYGNQRAQYPVNNHGFCPVDGPSAFGPQSYNRREQNVPLHSHELRARQRAMIAKKDGPSCGPVAGAAPFIVCYNCSKLLQLPADFSSTGKGKHKLRCGSCSQLISFEFDGRRLFPASTANITSENVNGCKDVTNGNMNGHPVNSYSGDFDSPGYEVHSAYEKLVLPSFPVSSNEMIEKEYGLHLRESEKMQEISSSPSISEDVDSLDSLICQRDVPSSTEFPLDTERVSRVSSLPLREHFGHTLSNQVVDGPGNGSRSRRSVQEKVLSVNDNFKQNSVKEIPVATEMDLPDDECPDADLSQDPWEVSNDENQPIVKNCKSGESFFAGLIKKSFIKDFSKANQSTEGGRCKVSVNGHPISDRLVKKAEKLAGPVHPGDYWYDYRAGFWGAIGHACLGIIPPFIEEFNYPMPKNCAGGNTGVLVNGRELHERDLSLLASRGLPATEGHSYIIEISGKVWDEASGEELDSLGKLAPTIEKVKHGFGMRVPRLIAQVMI